MVVSVLASAISTICSQDEPDLEALRSVLSDSPGVASKESVQLALRVVTRDAIDGKFEKESDKSHHSKAQSCIAIVDFSIAAAEKEICSPNVPFALLEDVFECLTIPHCQLVFEYLESKIAVFTSELFYQKGWMSLLRMCNLLKRRLSRSHDTIFCGRIMVFLAGIIPLSDKSGVNLAAGFNDTNITVFNAELSGAGEDGIDFTFYKKLWSLQAYFNNPNLIMNAEKRSTFMVNLEAILMVFNSQKLDLGSDTLTDSADSAYFPKYLTSEKLMNLQLNDSTFRRQILFQTLVVFRYIMAPMRTKSEEVKLPEQFLKWAQEKRDSIFKLLEETPPDPSSFVDSVKQILSREFNWKLWKSKRCPSFEKSSKDDLVVDKTHTSSHALKRKRDDGVEQISLGSEEMTRLWNLSQDNLVGCRAPERRHLPTLKSYFEESLEQIDPGNQIEKNYWNINKPAYCWKALRLLAKSRLSFLTNVENNGQKQQQAGKDGGHKQEEKRKSLLEILQAILIGNKDAIME